jgi:hypothetical protein
MKIGSSYPCINHFAIVNQCNEAYTSSIAVRLKNAQAEEIEQCNFAGLN